MPCSGEPKAYDWDQYDPTGLVNILNRYPGSFTWCGVTYYKEQPPSAKYLRRVRKTITTVKTHHPKETVTIIEEFE